VDGFIRLNNPHPFKVFRLSGRGLKKEEISLAEPEIVGSVELDLKPLMGESQWLEMISKPGDRKKPG
jgi:hypothetical protein